MMGSKWDSRKQQHDGCAQHLVLVAVHGNASFQSLKCMLHMVRINQQLVVKVGTNTLYSALA